MLVFHYSAVKTELNADPDVFPCVLQIPVDLHMRKGLRLILRSILSKKDIIKIGIKMVSPDVLLL